MVQRRDATQVVSLNQKLGDVTWMGELGHNAGLKYADTLPGGPSTAGWVLQRPATFRVTAMDPGRIVRMYRGVDRIWEGLMNEPSPQGEGWQMTADGSGTYGNRFRAIYTTFNQNDALDEAILRGLRWKKSSFSSSGLWLGDVEDSGSQTVTDFLNSITVQGGMTWHIDRRDGTLTLIALPTVVNRILVCTTPVARTIAESVNSLYLRFQSSADNSTTGAAATYGLANSKVQADIDLHDVWEEYYDLSENGTMSSGSAAANGANILKRYGRASFSDAFTVRQGQLLNAGGVPVDLGAEKAGTVCRLVLTDFGYGGEVSAAPVSFVVGEIEYDDTTQTAQITPFQNVRNNFQSLLAAMFPTTSTPDGS